MAIENSFRDSRELIQVSDMTEKYPEIFDTIIITFQSKVLAGLLEKQLVSEIPGLTFGSCHSKYPIYRISDYPNMLFYLCPITAPMTVGTLEEIHYSLGVKNIVMYGSCGVLDRTITAGKIIVPTKAYRDEGTSYHYKKASEFIDITKASWMQETLGNLNVSFVSGYTWTTDGFYRETAEIVAERKQQGCIVVEMEISAVQAFADLRGVNLYPFLYGADNLDSAQWERRILGNLPVDDRVKYFLLAVNIAALLMK